jgi:outer membrane protein TolC
LSRAALLLLFSLSALADDAAQPLSLAQAQAMALQNNGSFVVMQQDLSIAERQIRIAKGVFAPRLVADIHYTYNHDPGNFFFTEYTDQQFVHNVGVVGRVPTGLDYKLEWNTFYDRNTDVAAIYVPAYRTTLQLSLSQPLLRNAWLTVNRAPMVIASLRRDASRFLGQAEAEKILADVEIAYWELVLAHQELTVRQNAVRLAQEQVAESQTQLKHGAVAQIDVTEAEASVARRLEDVEVSRAEIAEAEGRLKSLLQTTAAPTFAPSDVPTLNPRGGSLAERIAIALERRPDLAAARVGLQADKVAVAVAKNRLWPAFDVFGSVGVTGFSGSLSTGEASAGFNDPTQVNHLTGQPLPAYRPDPSLEGGNLGNMFENLRFINGTIGVKLDVALDNSAAIANHENAKAQVKKLEALLKSLERQIAVQVATAEKRLEVDQARIHATAEAARLAEALLDGQRKRFHNGVAVSFDVLRANDEAARARIANLRAQLSARISEARLALAQGTYLDERNLTFK